MPSVVVQRRVRVPSSSSSASSTGAPAPSSAPAQQAQVVAGVRKRTAPEQAEYEKAVMTRLKPFMRSSTPRALYELALSFIVFGFTHTPWCPGGVFHLVLTALIKVRIFVQFHDMAHGSFFPSWRWNKMVGYVCGALSFTPFEAWQGPHNTHHAHLANVEGNLEQAGEVPTWTVKQYMAASPTIRFLYRGYRHPAFMFGVLPWYVFIVSYRFWRLDRRDTWICNALMAARLIALYHFCGGWSAVGSEFLVEMLAATIGFFLFFSQHTFNPFQEQVTEGYSAVKAGVHSSTYFTMPAIMHWFTGNIGYHHIHHITTRVPSYYLEEAHYALEDLWQDVTRITWAQAIAGRNLGLWDDETKEYITCADADRLIANKALPSPPPAEAAAGMSTLLSRLG